jgi:hypothetical protein
MARKTAAVAGVVVAALVLAIPVAARAQAELQALLDPQFGRQIARGEYRLTWYPSESVDQQSTELELLQHSVSFFVPLPQSERDEWSISGRARLQEYETDAVLPDTGMRFPSQLWEVLAGVTYRHRFENNWIAGVGLSFGSASDEPFASEDELIFRAFAFLRVPFLERHAGLFSLFYVPENRELGGFPIPGIAYMYMSEQFRLVFGLPFSAVEYQPIEELTLEAQYFPVRRIRARVTYRPFRPFRVFLGFDWDFDAHYLRDREDEDDRLFYYEKRVSAGARFDLRHIGFDVTGGWAFDRFFFEGDSYGDRDFNRLDIDDGPFVAARVSVRF